METGSMYALLMLLFRFNRITTRQGMSRKCSRADNGWQHLSKDQPTLNNGVCRIIQIVKHFGLNAWISIFVGSQKWQSSSQSCWSFSNSRKRRTAHKFLRMGTSSIAGNVFDKDYKFLVYKSTLIVRFHTDKWAVSMD